MRNREREASEVSSRADVLHVRVSRATETVWEGAALSISSTNSHGAFDILPNHANFITLIKEKEVLIEDIKREVLKFTFKQCVMHVHANVVKVYVDIL